LFLKKILLKIAKHRIKRIVSEEFGDVTDFDEKMILLALKNNSSYIKKIIEEAMSMDRMGEEPVFYDHHYPEDNTIVKFTKKPTN